MNGLQTLIKEKILPEYKKHKYIAIDLDKSDYFIFEPYLHKNNSKFYSNTDYCYETQDDFSGYAIKNKDTGKIEQFMLIFPYSKFNISFKDNEDLYNLGDCKYSIKKEYILGQIDLYRLLTVIIFIISFIIVPVISALISKYILIVAPILFCIGAKIEEIPKKEEKRRIEKQDAYIDGLKEYFEYKEKIQRNKRK